MTYHRVALHHNPVIANIKIYLVVLKCPKQKSGFLLDTLENPDISIDFPQAVTENLPKKQIKKIPKFHGQIWKQILLQLQTK